MGKVSIRKVEVHWPRYREKKSKGMRKNDWRRYRERCPKYWKLFLMKNEPNENKVLEIGFRKRIERKRDVRVAHSIESDTKICREPLESRSREGRR